MGEGHRPETGPLIVLLAEGRQGANVVARRRASPSMMTTRRTSWSHDRAEIESTEGARDREPPNANPGRWISRSWPRNGEAGRAGVCWTPSRGDIRAPEAPPLRSLPQPMGAGSLQPLRAANREPHAARRIGDPAARAKNPGTSPWTPAARTAAPRRGTDGEW